MKNLSELKCVTVGAGDPALTKIEIDEVKQHVSGWQIKEIDGINRLERVFKFKNFSEALSFANRVGALAEEQDHHPLIALEWGGVSVQWWTHVVKGLHKNDFIMAAKTDEVAID